MIEKITLQKFDDNFEDYYDSEARCFVLYAGSMGISNAHFATEAKITDYDGVEWDCYLFSVEYIPSLDMYEVKYKDYESGDAPLVCDFCGRIIGDMPCKDDGETIMCQVCEQSGRFGHYDTNKE